MSRLELLSSGQLRIDGRRPLELRSLAFHISPAPLRHAGADGSATVSNGLTTVSATVFGPRQRLAEGGGTQQQQQGGQAGLSGAEAKLDVEVEMPAWAGSDRRKRGRGDRQISNLASSLQSAFAPCVLLHLYPRSSIRIYVTITAADGSLFASCVNAVSLALIDAGIAMLEPLVAVSVGFYAGGAGNSRVDGADEDDSSPGGTLLLDLNGTEESALPSTTLGIMPRGGSISLLELETRLHLDRLKQAICLGVEACTVLKAEMDRVIKARTRRLAKALGGRGVTSDALEADAKANDDDLHDLEDDDSMDEA